MAIRPELNRSLSPAGLTLVQDAEEDGLAVQQVEYWQNVRNLESLVRQHFETEVADEIVTRLNRLASEALSRDEPSYVDLEALATVRSDIIRRGAEIRNAKLWKKVTSLAMLAGSAVPLIFVWSGLIGSSGAIEEYFPNLETKVIPAINLVGVLGFGVPGLCLGAVAKSLLSNRIVSSIGLAELDNYYFSTGLYLVYLVVVFLFAFICVSLDVLVVGVGGYSLAAISNRPPSAFVLGVMCGFAETTIARRISKSMGIMDNGGQIHSHF